MSYPALLTQTITVWTPGTPDGFGGTSYSAPSQTLCRWQDENERYQDDAGVEFVSSAVVYTTSRLADEAFLCKGVSVEANPQAQSGAYRIRRIYETQNPAGTTIVYKHVLGGL